MGWESHLGITDPWSKHVVDATNLLQGTKGAKDRRAFAVLVANARVLARTTKIKERRLVPTPELLVALRVSEIGAPFCVSLIEHGGPVETYG